MYPKGHSLQSEESKKRNSTRLHDLSNTLTRFLLKTSRGIAIFHVLQGNFAGMVHKEQQDKEMKRGSLLLV